MNIDKNVALHDKTWFGTGGKASYYAQPRSVEDFAQAVVFARDKALAVFVLGEGANVLISDEGFDGLVIHPALSAMHDLGDGLVTVQAGASMQAVIDFFLDSGLIGLEEFSGIPGTVGGSVYINIHYFDALLSDFLVRATVIERLTGKIMTVDAAWFNFGYNQSTLQNEQWYLIDATLKAKQADPLMCAYARGRRDEIIRQRQRRYPNSRTCGSFFRNFTDEEVAHCSTDKKVPFVGYYLDNVGVKGDLSYAGAAVSYRHANMIVAQQGAKTADIIAVARIMQERVCEKFRLTPQPECRLIGFSEYPLYKSL